MGTTAPFRREIKITCCAPNALLDMGSPVLDRLQAPLLLIRRNEEGAESHGSRRTCI